LTPFFVLLFDPVQNLDKGCLSGTLPFPWLPPAKYTYEKTNTNTDRKPLERPEDKRKKAFHYADML